GQLIGGAVGLDGGHLPSIGLGGGGEGGVCGVDFLQGCRFGVVDVLHSVRTGSPNRRNLRGACLCNVTQCCVLCIGNTLQRRRGSSRYGICLLSALRLDGRNSSGLCLRHCLRCRLLRISNSACGRVLGLLYSLYCGSTRVLHLANFCSCVGCALSCFC